MWKPFQIRFKSRKLYHFLRKRHQAQSLLVSIGCSDARNLSTIFWAVENVGPFSFFSTITISSILSATNISSSQCAAADVLLWRNKKISASVLMGATAIWVLFEWLNYHFLTIVCFALVLGMLAQFFWVNISGLFNRYKHLSFWLFVQLC